MTTEPLPCLVPVSTITGRIGVIVDTKGALFVVEHGDGTRVGYARAHLKWLPPEPGALYLDMGQFVETVKMVRNTL